MGATANDNARNDVNDNANDNGVDGDGAWSDDDVGDVDVDVHVRRGASTGARATSPPTGHNLRRMQEAHENGDNCSARWTGDDNGGGTRRRWSMRVAEHEDGGHTRAVDVHDGGGGGGQRGRYTTGARMREGGGCARAVDVQGQWTCQGSGRARAVEHECGGRARAVEHDSGGCARAAECKGGIRARVADV
ncbi:hypothetical protein BJ912DRAFT_934123 [Pholiota molesta]|nr:hypothetical protein BJ912DRAFT_934123 [Pholiota molesta]